MKSKLLSLLIALATAAPALAQPLIIPHDGNFWQVLCRESRLAWAVGWIDGIDGIAPGRFAAVYGPMTADELVDGMNKLYHDDYRNRSIRLNEAAVFVAHYRGSGVDLDAAVAWIEELRKEADAAH
jgi:hypothetical protein